MEGIIVVIVIILVYFIISNYYRMQWEKQKNKQIKEQSDSIWKVSQWREM